MTTIDFRRDPDALGEAPDATYDLIVLKDGNIVFHDHMDSRRARLEVCVRLITCCDIFRDVDTSPVKEIQRRCGEDPDAALNTIAKHCRPSGFDIYATTTHKRVVKPDLVYSVITDYGSGHTVAEHFLSREARRHELVARAEQFFASPGHVPNTVLADEYRLAAHIAAFLIPATVALTESVYDERRRAYRPVGRALSVH